MASNSNHVTGRALAVAAILAVAGVASAQETAHLIVEVSQATLAPGESTEVRVLVAYAPSVGAPAWWSWPHTQWPQLARVAGFSLAVFDVNTNPAIGVTGTWSNLAFGGWASGFSSPGVISGNNVLNAQIGTGFGPPYIPGVTENPLLLWTATWTASVTSGPGRLDIGTDVLGTITTPETVSVWLQGGQIGPISVEDFWPCTDGQGVVTVIPAPGVAIIAVAGVLFIPWRRRPASTEDHA